MSVSAAPPPGVDHEVRVEGDLDAAVVLMTVQGRWGRSLCQAVTTELRKCLAEHPEALIVDLSYLYDPESLSAPTWMAARRAAAAREPAVQLALCIPPHLPLADRMQRLGSRLFLPVYAKVRQARVAITGRLPLIERASLTLPPEPESPSIARNLVGDACQAWGLPDLAFRSRQVMSELVTNAIEHAGTPIVVVVSLRGSGVHLTVADGVAVPPRLLVLPRPQRDKPLDDRGRGLQLVRGMAAAWGWLPTRTGKLVWATVQAGPGPATELR